MKAILVIDMPQDCLRCPCYQPAFDEYLDDCKVALRPLTTEERDSRPNWCPLKPMPKKIDANYWHRMFGGTYKEREAKGYGWNACIDELLGEELIKSFDKKDGVEIDIPIGGWYEETDKRKPDEEMVYLKFDGTEYIWKDDMWVRIK